MNQTECPACQARIDLSSEPPGSSFCCPVCGQAEIPVSDTRGEIEMLDPSLEVVDEPTVRPRVTQRARSMKTRRGSGGGRRPAGGRARSGRKAPEGPGKPLLIGGALVLLVGALFVILRNGADQDAPGSTDAVGSKTASGPTDRRNESDLLTPDERIQRQREALAPGDLQGRLSLAAQCAESGLQDEQMQLLREVLLLDAQNAVAREAHGFRKYQGPATRYRGLWLDAEEYRLAEAAEPSKSDREH